jgi:hypothetical protein
LQIIKTFLRVTQDLSKLNEREIASNPISENLTQCRMFMAIADLLSNWCHSEQKYPTSDAFRSMVQVFVMNLYSWVSSFRSGSSAKDAWPLPAATRVSASEAHGPTNDGINQPAPEINLGVTTPDEESADATSAACRS